MTILSIVFLYIVSTIALILSIRFGITRGFDNTELGLLFFIGPLIFPILIVVATLLTCSKYIGKFINYLAGK